MRFLLFGFFCLAACLVRADEEIEKVSLPLIHDLKRADLYFLKITEQPVGVLVLCPGCNGNGRDWVQSPVWQQFARDHNLNMVGVSFASEVSLLTSGRGYYYAREGSGQLLLDGIRHAFHEESPLIMYGFSGGAHFTSGFVEWNPERVAAWCAYSAEWWDKPVSSESRPPGLVICGEDDERLGASLVFFKQGRALGKPWLWVIAPQTGHSIYGPAEKFARDYFSAILSKSDPSSGLWVDINLKANADKDTVTKQPSATGWLPDGNLLSEWQEVHHP